MPYALPHPGFEFSVIITSHTQRSRWAPLLPHALPHPGFELCVTNTTHSKAPCTCHIPPYLLQALAAAVSLCFPQLHSLNVGSVSLLCRRADSSNLLRAGLAWDPKVKAYRGDRFARQVGFRIPDRGADLPSFYFGFGMALSLSWFLCPHPALTFA